MEPSYAPGKPKAKALKHRGHPIRDFWGRNQRKLLIFGAAIVVTSALYFAARKDDEKLSAYEQQMEQLQTPVTSQNIQKPPAYEQPAKQIDITDAPTLTKKQVQDAERLFMGAQRLKLELKGKPDEYLLSLELYCAMIDDIASQLSALKIGPENKILLFDRFLKIFSPTYWEKNADRPVDALYLSLKDKWYDCDAIIVWRDVAAKLGISMDVYFAWDPASQKFHSFAGDGSYGYEASYGQMFPIRELEARYPFIYGKASTPDSALFATCDQLAYNLWDSKKYSDAIKLYDESLKLNRNSAPAYFSRGNCYLELKDYGAAEKDFKQAMDIWPEFSPAQNGMGILCQNTNRHAEAIGYFKASIKLFPKDPLVHYLIGLSYLVTGDSSKGIDALKESLRLNPDQPKVKSKLEQAEKMLNASR